MVIEKPRISSKISAESTPRPRKNPVSFGAKCDVYPSGIHVKSHLLPQTGAGANVSGRDCPHGGYSNTMKISKQSLEEQAANYLREQILAGDYRSGDKLVESSLAKTLDLSRTTVRMALNTLASEGLISQKPYAGWQVITMDDNDLWEIYHLRVALESQAARMAAERITQEKRDRLIAFFNGYLALCERDDADIDEVSQQDLELHRLIVDLSESQRLAKMYNMVANQMIIYMQMTHYDYSIRDSALSHKTLVDAICEGDVEQAGVLARENISTFTELGHKLKRQQSAHK